MAKYILLILSFFLYCCSSGGGSDTTTTDTDDSTGDTTTSTTDVFSFDSTTITPNIIDPAINAGAFIASWSITNGGKHAVTVNLSSDSILNTGDIEIYSVFCGAAVLDAACANNPAQLSCGFDNNNLIYCDDPADTIDLTTFVSGGLPKQAYMIFEICENLLTNCKASAVSITLQ